MSLTSKSRENSMETCSAGAHLIEPTLRPSKGWINLTAVCASSTLGDPPLFQRAWTPERVLNKNMQTKSIETDISNLIFQELLQTIKHIFIISISFKNNVPKVYIKFSWDSSYLIDFLIHLNWALVKRIKRTPHTS